MENVAINYARIDFVTLRLFCFVAQSGSMTKGAAQCHLALSAASRRLADFEAMAGMPLCSSGRLKGSGSQRPAKSRCSTRCVVP